MKRIALLVVAAAGLVACGDDDDSTDETTAPTAPLDAWQTPLGDVGAYTVARLALPEGAVIDAAALLQSAQDQALAGVGGTLTSEQAIDLNGIPGREFSATVSQGGVEGTIVQRVYLAGNTVYQINFAGEGDRSFTDPELAPFFESFTITV